MPDGGGDPARRRGSLSALLANKQKRGRVGGLARHLLGTEARGLARGNGANRQGLRLSARRPAGSSSVQASRGARPVRCDASAERTPRAPAGPRDGLQVPASPEAAPGGRGLAQFPGIRRAGKRRGGRSGGWRAASAGGGGADVGQNPACQGGGWPGSGGRLSERSPRLARRPQLGPGSADGSGNLRAPARAVARHSQAHGPSRSGAPRSRAATARGPRPRRSQRRAACALMAARLAGA